MIFEKMKLPQVIISSAIFSFLLFLIYYLHIRFFKVDVVFYAAISDGIIAALIAAVLIYLHSYFSVFTCTEKYLLVSIWLVCGYAFAISVPTVIDRSLSFYILEKLDQRGGGILKDKFEIIFIGEYLNEHRLVDVRLTEQLSSGTIKIENGCVRLTQRGKSLVTFSRYVRRNLLPKQRLLLGEYSDDLTNPFRNSLESPDYKC